MRRALLSDSRQQASGSVQSVFIKPPTGGFKSDQNPHQSDPNFATDLTNFWPAEAGLFVREGCTLFASRASIGHVKSIYAYASPNTANYKLFAFTDSGAFDITAGGAFGPAVKAITNGYWQGVHFINSAGGIFLWGVNGSDDAMMYDGTSWTSLNASSTPPITIATTSLLTYCW